MFENLQVYQKAVDLADRVATLAEEFPRGYYFLADQLNRAALSVAANTAEGNGRFTKADRRTSSASPAGASKSAYRCWNWHRVRCCLKQAGIPKTDSRGWTVDVHALRHTFGTLLSKGNVAPRTAQAAMRHSTIDLTMNVYTDPQLLDVAGALDCLPELPLRATAQARISAATVVAAGRA